MKIDSLKDFISNLVAPAQRALISNGITSISKLATYSENELLELHGIGPTTIPKLKAALAAHGLQLRSSTVKTVKPIPARSRKNGRGGHGA